LKKIDVWTIKVVDTILSNEMFMQHLCQFTGFSKNWSMKV